MAGEHALQQAQMYQQQVRALAAQKEAVMLQLAEIRTAKTELEKAADGVYRVSGPLLLRSTKKEAAADLAEKEELLALRLKTLESSEKKLQAKLDELRGKLGADSGEKPVIVPKKGKNG